MKTETKLRLIEYFGTQRKIAAFTGRCEHTVYRWLRGSHPIPVRIATRLAAQTGADFNDMVGRN